MKAQELADWMLAVRINNPEGRACGEDRTLYPRTLEDALLVWETHDNEAFEENYGHAARRAAVRLAEAIIERLALK